MKVLVSAFSCCPGRGSEPGIGWNWVQQISRQHEVWLLTTDEFRREVLQAATPQIHATFIPSFEWWNWLHKSLIPGLDWLYYYWWQWKAYRAAVRLHSKVRFDLAHHVTLGSWRAPSFLSLLPLPFVWGPIGGGETLPRAFWSELGRFGFLLEMIRTAFQVVSMWDPFVHLTARRAALILVANRDTQRFVPANSRSKARFMTNAGIHFQDALPEPTPAEQDGSFLVLFAGVFDPRKGGGLLLRAFQHLLRMHPGARLCMLGAGRDLQKLSSLSNELGIADSVHFPGWLSRSEVLRWMARADALVLPSLRDSGGFVLLEAMLAAKPVICLDLGGPGEYVTPQCGIKIQPTNPEQAVVDISAALARLASDPELRIRLGQAARARVLGHFDWNEKGAELMRLYDEVCETKERDNPCWQGAQGGGLR